MWSDIFQEINKKNTKESTVINADDSVWEELYFYDVLDKDAGDYFELDYLDEALKEYEPLIWRDKKNIKESTVINMDDSTWVELYFQDIMWELYFEDIVDKDADDYFELDCLDETLREYEPLMWRDKKNSEPCKTFVETVNRLKGMSSGIKLLDCFERKNYKVDKDNYVIRIPDGTLIAFHILFLQNMDFIRFMKSPQSKQRLLCEYKNIIKYGKLLDKYNEINVYGYVYERLTGVNIALLFSNYYEKMIKYFEFGQIAIYYRREPDGTVAKEVHILSKRKPKQRILESKQKLQTKLEELLAEILRFSMVFGRVILADIILSNMCNDFDKYVENSDNPGYIEASYEYIEEKLFENIEYISRKLKKYFAINKNGEIRVYEEEGITEWLLGEDVEEKCMSLYIIRNPNVMYDTVKKEIVDRLKNEKKIYKLWKEIETGEYNNWGHIQKEIRKANESHQAIHTAYNNLGKFVKKEIKEQPYEKMPIIFINDEIVTDDENKESINLFLKCALSESNCGNKRT